MSMNCIHRTFEGPMKENDKDFGRKLPKKEAVDESVDEAVDETVDQGDAELL